MKLIILPLIIFACVHTQAQIDYPTQPKEGYYEDLKKRIVAVVPKEDKMIAMKAEALPAGFKDTLLKYDWYLIANYYFFDKEYASNFTGLENLEKVQASNQFNFFRYNIAGIRYEMSLHRYRDATMKVKTTTFDENNAAKLAEIKKVNTKNMMVTLIFGEKEMQEILSYKNGIMVMNIKQTPNATTKRFHIAYMAVPKTF